MMNNKDLIAVSHQVIASPEKPPVDASDEVIAEYKLAKSRYVSCGGWRLARCRLARCRLARCRLVRVVVLRVLTATLFL